MLRRCGTSTDRDGEPLELFDNRPTATRAESGYFDTAELPKVIAQLPTEGFEATFRTMILVAVKTGMRHGEIAALRWGDIDLTARQIRVRRSVSKGIASEPKNRQVRTVQLLDETATLLGRWWGEQGSPEDDAALVFPDETGGMLADQRAYHRLRKAMKAAGVPIVGVDGSSRGFHSLRHTFAAISIQSGVEMLALSRQLGHSSMAVTYKHHGHLAVTEAKRRVAKLEGAFNV